MSTDLAAPPDHETETESRRPRPLVVGLVALLVLAAAFGLSRTWSAWVVTDSNGGNTFSTGTVLIEDNQGGSGGSTVRTGTAMFNVANLSPGSAATTKCMGVNFSGTTADTLTLSATLGGPDAPVLRDQLKVEVAEFNTSGSVAVTNGTNTNNGSCASYPAGGTNTAIGTQGATMNAWSSAGAYAIPSPVTNTWYRFRISGLPPTATDCATYCGKSITLNLTWTLTTTTP